LTKAQALAVDNEGDAVAVSVGRLGEDLAYRRDHVDSMFKPLIVSRTIGRQPKEADETNHMSCLSCCASLMLSQGVHVVGTRDRS
jgi:hypothetical protein